MNISWIRALWLMVALCAISVTACGGDDKEDAPVFDFSQVKFSPAALLFEAEPSGTQQITISGLGSKITEVSVRTDATWCSLTADPAHPGTYTVGCEANTSAEPRTCQVKIFHEGVAKVSMPVSQAGFAAPEPDDPVVPSKPENAASPLGLGWNLGNQMDAWSNEMASETVWGNPVATRQLFTAVKAAGFNSVRIPVTWLGKVGDAPDYKIDQAWLDRVATLVGYAEDAGLKVVINIHHDGADSAHWLDIKNAATNSATNELVKAKLRAMWSQIATRFADKGDFLYFESMNEIHDGAWGWGDNRKNNKQYATFNEWQQVFVDAVRAAGGNNADRWVIVPTYCTNIDLGDHLVLPNDPAGKTIVAVHLYEPYEYTLEAKYDEWGHTGKSGQKPASNEATLVGEFNKILSKWINKGIPAYIGEFGCVHRQNERGEAFRKYYLEYFCKAASDRNIPVVYWDNGSKSTGRESSGLFDRTTGAFVNNAAEIVAAMNKGYTTTDAAYTLESVYNSAPK